MINKEKRALTIEQEWAATFRSRAPNQLSNIQEELGPYLGDMWSGYPWQFYCPLSSQEKTETLIQINHKCDLNIVTEVTLDSCMNAVTQN